MDLFDFMRENTMDKESPLASRLRPVTLDEVVGQQHIIGKDKLLYRAIKADKLGSVIFYGPPGTGKTTLAKVIANTTSADFKQINATVAGKKDMEEIVEVGGYFNAVQEGFFVDSAKYPERNGDGIARKIEGGVGYGYIFERAEDYMAPVTAHYGYNNVEQYGGVKRLRFCISGFIF